MDPRKHSTKGSDPLRQVYEPSTEMAVNCSPLCCHASA